MKIGGRLDEDWMKIGWLVNVGTPRVPAPSAQRAELTPGFDLPSTKLMDFSLQQSIYNGARVRSGSHVHIEMIWSHTSQSQKPYAKHVPRAEMGGCHGCAMVVVPSCRSFTHIFYPVGFHLKIVQGKPHSRKSGSLSSQTPSHLGTSEFQRCQCWKIWSGAG